jgi:hypothetical protein
VAGKARTASHGLKLAGRRLWDHVLERFELEEYERLLLLEACRTVDIVNELQAAADALAPEDARLILAEARQQRLAYARLVAALRLPVGLDEFNNPRQRQQRRSVRGVYQPRPGGA